MFALQDSYAEATQHLGLERGVKNSQAEHTTVKDYYSVVNAASGQVNTSDLQAIQARAIAYTQMQKEHQELKRRLKLVAQKRDELEQKLEITQEKLAVQQQIDLAVSDPQALVSLGQIACELRLPPGQIDGDIPALDLVMNTRQTDLAGATQWLNQRFGAAATIGLVNDRVRQIVTEQLPEKFTPPRPKRGQWGEVKDYLTTKKQLPAKLVERLHEEGLIYADEGGKLICLHRDFEERVTGATSIDLRSDDLQSESIDGSGLSVGWHYFQSPPQGQIDKVVVMDDPLEAMAYATLNPTEETTLFLAGHEGGWMPGDKLHRVDVVVGSKAEFYNLLGQVEYELPQSESWGEDLEVYLDESIEKVYLINVKEAAEEIEESYNYGMGM